MVFWLNEACIDIVPGTGEKKTGTKSLRSKGGKMMCFWKFMHYISKDEIVHLIPVCVAKNI